MSNPYTLTLGDVKANTSIRNISGVCVTSEEFVEQVNQATRRLMRRGNWWKTEVLMRVCFEGCRIVWPRQVGTVMGMRFCGQGGMMQLKNNWWAVAGYRSGPGYGYAYGNGGALGTGWYGGGPMVGFDDDTAPTYREITGNSGKYLRWSIVKATDLGKTMKVYGFQYGGQPLQELNSDGAWVPGITLTAATPYVQTTTLVTQITGIRIQGVTDGLASMEGMSYLYQVDPTSGDLLDLGAYQPGETKPDYRVTKVDGICQVCAQEDSYGRKIRQAEALVKLEFIPVERDYDPVLIGNIDALRYAIMAGRAESESNWENSETLMAKAIKECNMELRDRDPDSKTAIRCNDIGGNCVIGSAI